MRVVLFDGDCGVYAAGKRGGMLAEEERHEAFRITHLLARVASGDRAARSDLYAVVYPELHACAQAEVRRRGGLLDPVALVSDYLCHLMHL